MKDVLISGKRKKKELLTFLACFVLANIIHLFAILKYDNTSMTELVTSIGYVTVFAIALYVVWTGIRLVLFIGCNLFRSKKGS